jgi:hypothetical protein
MFWIEPEEVSLLGHALGGVESVEIDRRATRLAMEWSDAGPHAVFADAPEQRVDVRIARRLEGGDGAFEASVTPGAAGELSFAAGVAGSDAGRVRVSASVVVTAVEHGLRAGGCAQQRILCVAVSADGAADPVTITKEAP